MKKIILIFLILSNIAFADLVGFMDNLVNSISTSGSSSEGDAIYKATKRHYIVGGRFRYVLPTENVNFVSINPPEISAGCGGISITLGSVSSLGFDYLVSKLQNVVKTMPLVAVQLVISNLSEKLNSIMSFAEEISDVINMLNMDTCTLSKAGVGYTVKNIGLFTDKFGGGPSFSDHFKFLKDFQDGAVNLKTVAKDFVEDTIEKVTGSAGYYDCFLISDEDQRKECIARLSGEVLHMEKGLIYSSLALTKLYNNSTFKEFADVLRAHLGDLVLDVKKNKIEYIEPACDIRDESSFLHSFFDLKSLPKSDINLPTQKLDGTCGKINIKSVLDRYKNMLSNIYTSIASGSPLSLAQKTFLSSIDIPVAYYFKSLSRIEYLDPSLKVISQDMLDKIAYYLFVRTYLLSMKRLLGQMYASINKMITNSSQNPVYKDYKNVLMSYREDIQAFSKEISSAYPEIIKGWKDTYDAFFKKVRDADEMFIKYLRDNYLKASYNYGR